MRPVLSTSGEPIEREIYYLQAHSIWEWGRTTKQKEGVYKCSDAKQSLQTVKKLWPIDEHRIAKPLSDVARNYLWVALRDGNSVMSKLAPKVWTNVEVRLSAIVIENQAGWQSGTKEYPLFWFLPAGPWVPLHSMQGPILQGFIRFVGCLDRRKLKLVPYEMVSKNLHELEQARSSFASLES